MISHRPRSSRTSAARRCLGLGAAAVLAAAAPLAGLGTASTASAADCPDVEVIFARGTDEPEGMGRVGDALVASLNRQAGVLDIRTYAVDYKAGKLQLHGGDGAKDVISRIQSTASSCPSTKIVLGGYSQGATVIDIVAGIPVGGIKLGDPLPARYATNVAAVVTFGNVIGRSEETVANKSALLGSKALDLCNPGDPICHAGPGNSWSGHTEGYVPQYTEQAATFVATALLAGYPSTYPGYGSQLLGHGAQPDYGYPYGYPSGSGVEPGPQSGYDPSGQTSEHMPPGWDSDTLDPAAHGTGSGPSVYEPAAPYPGSGAH